MLRVGELLCLLLPHHILRCLTLLLPWLAREGALSLCQKLTLLGWGRMHLFFFLGGMDIHYTSAAIATSSVCGVHHKPQRPRLTTHSELVQARILNVVESKTSNRQSKASHPARKHACFCPPTMHDTKLDQLNKARVKGYSKYCQGRAHAKLLNQHVFKPYIWPSHGKAPRSSNNIAHRCSTCKER